MICWWVTNIWMLGNSCLTWFDARMNVYLKSVKLKVICRVDFSWNTWHRYEVVYLTKNLIGATLFTSHFLSHTFKRALTYVWLQFTSIHWLVWISLKYNVLLWFSKKYLKRETVKWNWYLIFARWKIKCFHLNIWKVH